MLAAATVARETRAALTVGMLDISYATRPAVEEAAATKGATTKSG
jgi:hypothetical protein